jgi:hypothetical protein
MGVREIAGHELKIHGAIRTERKGIRPDVFLMRLQRTWRGPADNQNNRTQSRHEN